MSRCSSVSKCEHKGKQSSPRTELTASFQNRLSHQRSRLSVRSGGGNSIVCDVRGVWRIPACSLLTRPTSPALPPTPFVRSGDKMERKMCQLIRSAAAPAAVKRRLIGSLESWSSVSGEGAPASPLGRPASGQLVPLLLLPLPTTITTGEPDQRPVRHQRTTLPSRLFLLPAGWLAGFISACCCCCGKYRTAAKTAPSGSARCSTPGKL